MTPLFKDFTLHEMDVMLDYGMSVPWSKNSSLRFSGSFGSLLSWERTKGQGPDTLNSFFERGLFIRGYPYLQDTENVLLRGENTILLGLDYNQVLFGDIFKTWWIFFIEDVYGQLFYETGRAWNGKYSEVNLFGFDYWDESKQPDAFRQTLGWGLKLNSRIYHNFPFLLFFEAATALNHVTTNEGALKEIEKIDLFGLSTYSTKISMGISFGFYNGLLSGKPSRAKPTHSMSKTLNYFGR